MPHAHVPKVAPADRIAFSPSEISALTGFSPAFVAELIKSRALRSAKIGGRRIITARALAELLGESGAELPTLAMAISNGAAAIGEPPPSTAATVTPAMPVQQRDQPRRNAGKGSRAAERSSTEMPAPVIAREQLDAYTAADSRGPPAVLVSASTPPERRDIAAAPPRSVCHTSHQTGRKRSQLAKRRSCWERRSLFSHGQAARGARS